MSLPPRCCYENIFNINLEEYHRHICRINDNEAILVQLLNESNRIAFHDGVSSTFKLEIHNRLLYLVGDKTSYPCSNVVESVYGSELNWVKCIVMPGALKVKGETDIRNSAIIISQFSDLIPQISDEKLFFHFIDQLKYTFSECKWFKQIYSVSLYVRLAKFWDYRKKITKLYELGLLYPLEFSVYSLYKDVDIKNERILKFFFSSLAESTNKIFSFEEINNIFKSLSKREIKDVLAIDKVAQNVRFDMINDEYFADLLEIDADERYPQFVDGIFNLRYMQDRAASIFKTQSFRKEYSTILKRNFRALENKIRKGKGYDNVGSFFIEKLLYNKLRADFPGLTVDTQYSPPWLRPQRIDIYIVECVLAIEYHGAQHYLPIDFFGGIEGLESRKKLDQRKKEKCLENKVVFFEICYDEDFDLAYNSLKLLIQSLF